MAKRIYERYKTGDRVEIVFSARGESAWQPAQVLRPEPPGIWVKTPGGQEWFVTNLYRIRKVENDSDENPG